MNRYPPKEKFRQLSARENVLARLRQGVATNIDLNKVCYRYGARILELRKQGHHITTKPMGSGVFAYQLEAAC